MTLRTGVGRIQWVECEPTDDRPIYGPRCPGPQFHTWALTVQEGRAVLSVGCDECHATVWDPVGGEDLEMYVEVKGQVRLHLERYPEDVTWWWEFVPLEIAEDE